MDTSVLCHRKGGTCEPDRDPTGKKTHGLLTEAKKALAEESFEEHLGLTISGCNSDGRCTGPDSGGLDCKRVVAANGEAAHLEEAARDFHP